MPQFKKGLQKVHTLRKTIVYLSPYLSTMLTFQRSARELILAPDPDPIAESRGLVAESLLVFRYSSCTFLNLNLLIKPL